MIKNCSTCQHYRPYESLGYVGESSDKGKCTFFEKYKMHTPFWTRIGKIVSNTDGIACLAYEVIKHGTNPKS